MTFHLSGDAQVVAVVAHPDDDALMFYGTLRRWRCAGATVTVVVVTHGANGVSLSDQAAGLRLDTAQRPAEVERSYEGTGITIRCLGLDDGTLRAGRDLISVIEATLTDLNCTVLLTHQPHPGNDHQDHLAVAQAAVNAAARVLTCTTVLHGQPHAPHHLAPSPQVLVDITPYLSDKIKALQRHEPQINQSGRYYLTEDYTRWRAATAGWSRLPAHTAAGRSFEGLTASLILLDLNAPRNTAPPAHAPNPPSPLPQQPESDPSPR